MNAMEDLYRHLEELPAETLFIFDIDYVITMPQDPLLQILASEEARSHLGPMLKELSHDEHHLFYTLTVLQGEQRLVEATTRAVLDNISAKGHRLMALTALHVAQVRGCDTTLARIGELRRLGIDFAQAFPHVEPFFVLEELTHYFHGKPTYREGVLFSNSFSHDKGTVLNAFLKAIDHRPPAIVFVDDLQENILDVERTAHALGIPFWGLHYRGAYQDIPQVDMDAARTLWLKLIHEAKELCVSS